MSQPNEVLKQEAETALIQDYVFFSVLSLVSYEYVITLDREIAAVWRRKFTVTSLLLLAVRWLMVLGLILQVAQPGDSQAWCTPGHILNVLIYLAVTVLISVFSALRVYALWQGSRMKYAFPAIVLALGMIPVGTNIFNWARSSITFVETPQVTGCFDSTNIPPKLSMELLFLTRCSLIASDILVLILTWVKSLAQWRAMRRLKLGSSVSTVLLRDGSLYFLALLGVSILQLLTYSSRLEDTGTYAIVFIQSLPPLLVQRFILNLRQLGPATEASEPGFGAQHVSRLSLRFGVPSDFLGNIGESLDHGQSEHIEEHYGDDDRCVADDQRDRLEEGLAQHSGPLIVHLEEPTEADIASVLRSTERANKEDDVCLTAFPREAVLGPYLAAD
ncbi:uncharacterized protein PHACADRAFT_246036 [Phanerochaete carnosa HHB-10118-sp]|uniref:DUF6533 domain-containing protein n=1 Tax=Phanerochaete carnosa (strain HHB-10118-sp) TaxID=650164 RepID=K5WLX6_PHACS|nr:uncharacterized protein PHACADRAFT_246036 [Phanerochaete carnosa HHB-10118-sp]EKM60189.1 hypothetical protein PHACADRAFT_246036 [Phanerochaete carnosa HHB-10118-sp]